MSTPRWLFGAPFDVTSLDEARLRIFAAAERREQLVFATPNVSFLAQADRDPRFREDILRVGMSLVDGMPIVWLGRLLGIRFAGRVAGSDLLESLISEPGPHPLRVYFFGGNPGAAEAASKAVNRRGGGLVAVGAHFPGFVGIDQMSTKAVIDDINRSGADLLIVALGAAKGHRWIESNRHRIEVPVISHLGAAINFAGGRLKRAPRILQQAGLEWLWRIKEEPALARRYARDGWFLLKEIAGFVLPELAWRRLRVPSAPSALVTPLEGGQVGVSITGRLGADEVEALQQASVATLNLAEVTQLDPRGVGWLYALRYRRPEGAAPVTVSCDAVSRTALARWHAASLADGTREFA